LICTEKMHVNLVSNR